MGSGGSGSGGLTGNRGPLAPWPLFDRSPLHAPALEPHQSAKVVSSMTQALVQAMPRQVALYILTFIGVAVAAALVAECWLSAVTRVLG